MKQIQSEVGETALADCDFSTSAAEIYPQNTNLNTDANSCLPMQVRSMCSYANSSTCFCTFSLQLWLNDSHGDYMN